MKTMPIQKKRNYTRIKGQTIQKIKEFKKEFENYAQNKKWTISTIYDKMENLINTF